MLGIIYHWGYLGIFFLLALARLVPPLPTETVIPLAGLGTASSEWNLFLLALVGGLGSTVGQLGWYLPARLWEQERLERFLREHGHWLTVEPQKVHRTTEWFKRRGGWAVLLAQPIPGVRTLVALPAGACNMPVWRYVLWSAVGSGAWTLVLAYMGHFLARWPWAKAHAGGFTLGLFGVLLLLYFWRLAKAIRARRRADRAAAAGAPLSTAT